MLDDERFNTISAVQQHLDEFMPILRGYFKTKTRDEWVDLIAGLNIVVGKIGHLKDLATDEQAIANEFVQDVEFPSGKKVAMPTVPIEFSAYDTKSKYEKTGEIGRDTEILPQGKKQKKQNEVKDHDSVVQRMSQSYETAQKIEREDPHRDHPCIPLSLP